MRRFVMAISSFAILLAMLAAGGVAQRTQAQTGTPAGAYAMPEGVTFEGLAAGVAALPTTGPTSLGLFRAGLEPGASIPLGADASAYLIYVESGAITFHVDAPMVVTRAGAGAPETAAPLTDVTLKQGDSAMSPPNPGGAAGEARNDGSEKTVALVVEAGPVPAGTPTP